MSRRMRMLVTCWLGLYSRTALAEQDGVEPEAARDAESRTYFNARGGFSTANENARPEVCVEGAPLPFLSAEACGTGAQVWHDDPAPEMAHFRLKGRFLSLPIRRFWLQSFAGLGFAELSVGQDEPGFAFNKAGAARSSTAGAELSLSVRALVPIAHGFEFISDATLSGAYLPHADELLAPRARFQPGLSLSLGVGF